MSDKQTNSLDAVNTSGFLFQLRVEQEIKLNSEQHRWQVLVHEHRWHDPIANESKYIDLILGKDYYRMVIECKRIQHTNWIFLQPDEMTRSSEAILHWCHNQLDQRSIAGWDKFYANELYCYQIEFCIQENLKNKRGHNLENIASELLQSIQSLAEEEGQLKLTKNGRAFVYMPVIVTTTPLYLCRFNISDIDLGKGTLDNAQLEGIPYVALRKSLTTRPGSTDIDILRKKLDHDLDIHTINVENERTVFIVNVQYLIDFLREVQNLKSNFSPWDTARRTMEESVNIDPDIFQEANQLNRKYFHG